MGKIIVATTDTSTRTGNTPVAAEILYDTDENKFYGGDGATAGGIDLGGSSLIVEDGATTITGVDTITASEGIQADSLGGGNAGLKADISGLTADVTPDGAADYLMTYDDSAGQHKKVLLNNLPGGSGTITVQDGAETLSGIDTLELSEGIQADSLGGSSAGITLDISGLTADATPVGSTDYVATWDNSAGQHKKVLLDDLPGGGGGLSAAQVTALIVASASGG